MRILYVCKGAIHTDSGPREHVFSVCDEFVKQGNKVVLLTYFPKDRFGKSRFPVVKVPNIVLGRYVTRNSRAWKYLIRIVVTLYKPDIIFERYTSNQITDNSRLNIPLVVEINGWPPDHMDENWIYKHYGQWEIEFLKNLSRASLIIVSSRGVAEKIKSLLPNELSKVHFIPNGVNLPSKVEPREILKNDNEIRIGYIGGFTKYQDMRTLFQAIKILSDRENKIRLHLFGDGSLRYDIEDLCQKVSIRNLVEFHGWVAKPELFKKVTLFDIAVAPYSRNIVQRSNGMDAAMKLFDYWAYRKPVIISDIPESPTYQQHHMKRFIAVCPEDKNELAEAILDLHKNEKIKEELVNNGYLYVKENHSWSVIVKRILDTVKQEVLHQ
jgi:glycosyltransferase involved in cell wall biosynthesis